MTIRLILTAAIFTISMGTAVAEFTPTRYHLPRTNSPPVIDGQLDDVTWQNSLVIDKFYQYKSGGTPANSRGTMRLTWDAENLYLGMEVLDNNILPSSIVTGRGGFDGPLYEGDVIELFVRQRGNSPMYHEFEWNAVGDRFDARFDTRRFGPPGTSWNSGMRSRVRVDGTTGNRQDVDTSYTVEAAIPLSVFEPVAVGTEWFFSFARYDYHFRNNRFEEELMMSTPGDPTAPDGGVTHGFHTYEIYDVLVFSPVPEPVSGGTWLPALAVPLAIGRRWCRRGGR